MFELSKFCFIIGTNLKKKQLNAPSQRLDPRGALLKENRSVWENIKIFHSGDDYFASMTQDIRNAQVKIQIEVYIFNMDRLTLPFLSELAEARQRGVLVEILVDGFGSFRSISPLQKFCIQNKMKLKVFRPFSMSETHFRKYFFKHFLKYLLKIKFIFRRLNRRNHRKITFIDSQIAYIGSFNNSEVHSEQIKGTEVWRDSGLRICGPELKNLVFSMQEAWKWNRRARILSYFKNKLWHYHPVENLIRLNTRRRWRRSLNRDLKRRIQNAQHHVLITSAYFLPTNSLLRAFKKAASRGVPVHIIVPGPSDVPLVNLAALKLYHQLYKAGVRIFQYQPSILHAKSMIIDDFYTLGSMNLNYRSLLHDLEVTVIINDLPSQKNLLDQWTLDLSKSQEFSYQSFENLSWIIKLMARLAFRFRYWL